MAVFMILTMIVTGCTGSRSTTVAPTAAPTTTTVAGTTVAATTTAGTTAAGTTTAAVTTAAGTTAGTTAAGTTVGTTVAGTSFKPGDSDKYAEHLTLNWMCFGLYNTKDYPPSDTQKFLEETYNITINVPLINVSDAQQFAAYFASGGGTDDIINSNVTTGYWKQFADQGVIRPIEESWLYDYAPAWMNNLAEIGIDKTTIDASIRYKDEVWMMPLANYAFAQTFIAGIRKADLDAAGKAAPKTLDEFHDLAVAISDKSKNVYASHGSVNGNLNYVFAAYDFTDGLVYSDDGKSVVYTRTTDRWKEILTLLAKWYGEGIIDPEFLTDDRAIQRSKWTEGKLRILIDHPWWWDEATSGSVYKLLGDKGEEQVMFGAVSGPYGNKSSVRTPNMNNNAFYFGANVSDKVIERFMRIKNEISLSDPLWQRLYYGVENVTFKRDANGKISYLPEVLAEAANNGKLGLLQNFAMTPITFKRQSDATITDASMLFYAMSDNQTKIVPSVLTTQDNKAYTERWPDVSTVATKYMNDAITGAVDIESTWSQYLTDLNSNGLDAVLKGYEGILIER